MAKGATYVGIDVSGEWLDVHVHPDGAGSRFSNGPWGVETLSSLLSLIGPELVAMEATGRLEERAARRLQEDGFEVAVVNPRQVRDFARALGPSGAWRRRTRSTPRFWRCTRRGSGRRRGGWRARTMRCSGRWSTSAGTWR